MEEVKDECVICGTKTAGTLVVAKGARIEKIIESSRKRGDDIHVSLQRQYEADKDMTITCHHNCVSTYTSKEHIRRHLKRNGGSMSQASNDQPRAKIKRRYGCSAFDFQQHCLFCGEQCSMEPDPRHPDRWRQAKLCRTADRGKDSKSFKEVILDACHQRQDDWSMEVEHRVQGALSDLHAADARYHDDCRRSFMSRRSIQFAAAHTSADADDVDKAFDAVLEEMLSDEDHIWTSVELYSNYQSHNGEILTRRALVQKLADHLGPELVILYAEGLANLLVFRNAANKFLRIQKDDDDDISVGNVAKMIQREAKGLCLKQNGYKLQINKEIADQDTSPTLMSLLAALSKNLDYTLPAIMIGNMVTAAINNRPTPLLVDLGVKIRQRDLIETLHDFGVTCSYDEYLRFKASAASSAATDKRLRGISDHSSGLIQVVADNFDTDISSQNGLQSTHSLAMLTTQNNKSRPDDSDPVQTIRRLRKEEMKAEVEADVPIIHYQGPKKPPMPQTNAKRVVPPLRILAQQSILVQRANQLDFKFLESVINDPKVPEYAGFNTRMSREENHSLKPGTSVAYSPLIDMVPSDPTTIMTAMFEARRITKQTGQSITVFTADQQLYRVAVNVVWMYPELSDDFVLRLGGMHTLMSFVGSVGTLKQWA